MEIEIVRKANFALRSQNQMLQERVAELNEALELFGHHETDCPKSLYNWDNTLTCTCGLNDVLNAPESRALV